MKIYKNWRVYTIETPRLKTQHIVVRRRWYDDTTKCSGFEYVRVNGCIKVYPNQDDAIKEANALNKMFTEANNI